jgi:hypothetical protein
MDEKLKRLYARLARAEEVVSEIQWAISCYEHNDVERMAEEEILRALEDLRPH